MNGSKQLKIAPNIRYLVIGLGLMLVAVMMPMIFTDQQLHIYDKLYQSLGKKDTGILLESAFLLIVLNTVRSTPNYMGIMMVMEGIQLTWNEKKIPFIKIPLCYLLHIVLYQIIYWIYGIQLDVGAFSLIIFMCIELLNRFSFRMENKQILIFLFLIAIQGLDIMPELTMVGFGKGEISMDIKAVAQILEGNRLLTYFSCLLFFSFAASTLLVALLDQEQRQLMQAHQKAKQDEVQLYEARMKNLEMRSFLEIQNLVHDLKSPLTAIQGLAELTESQLEGGRLKEHQHRIVLASERMSKMISEILYEDRKSLISTKQLLRMTLSYMAANPKVSKIIVDNRCPTAILLINTIRMSRALVNLLENACKAIDMESGSIKLTVENQGEETYWEIWDNGTGMSAEKLKAVWERGYSSSGSTGLGLSFVKQVVELHDGSIEIESQAGSYTRVMIHLPKERRDSDGKIYSGH